MPKIVVRPARQGDAAALRRLSQKALAYECGEEDTERHLAAVLGCPGYCLLVAEADGEVAGYIHAGDYDTLYNPPQKNILTLAVDPAYQRQGIGRALLSAVEAWAKDSGAKGVRLVSGYNRQGAHRFYEACGYINRKDQRNYAKLF